MCVACDFGVVKCVLVCVWPNIRMCILFTTNEKLESKISVCVQEKGEKKEERKPRIERQTLTERNKCDKRMKTEEQIAFSPWF